MRARLLCLLVLLCLPAVALAQARRPAPRLSPASLRVLSSLSETDTVTAFISPRQPRKLRDAARMLSTLLDRFAEASAGKLNFQVLQPAHDQVAARLARRYKISGIKVRQYRGRRIRSRRIHLGLVLQRGTRVQRIPFVHTAEQLEFRFTAALVRISRPPGAVAVAAGHGEASLTGKLRLLRGLLKDHAVRTVDLAADGAAVPADADLVLVVGPTRPYSANARQALERHLARGKALLLLLDGVRVQRPVGRKKRARVRVRKIDHGLGPLLKRHGVVPGQDLVLARPRQVLAHTDQRLVQLTLAQDFVSAAELDRSSPITRRLRAYVALSSPSIKLSAKATGKGKVRGVVLARSGRHSWRRRPPFSFDMRRAMRTNKQRGPFALAVSVRGPGARLVLIGGSSLAHSRNIKLLPGNVDLLLNAINVLTLPPDVAALGR